MLPEIAAPRQVCFETLDGRDTHTHTNRPVRLNNGHGMLQSYSGRLDNGLGRLQNDAERLDDGPELLPNSLRKLENGVGRLENGSERLENRLGRLEKRFMEAANWVWEAGNLVSKVER